MSMDYYPIVEYGFVFTSDAIKCMKKDFKDNFDADDEEICDILEKLGIRFSFEPEFKGEARPILCNCEKEWNDKTVYCDYELIVYIPLENRPSLFECAYNNKKEIKEELKIKLKDCSEDEFDDYLDYVYEIVGIYMG